MQYELRCFRLTKMAPFCLLQKINKRQKPGPWFHLNLHRKEGMVKSKLIKLSNKFVHLGRNTLTYFPHILHQDIILNI